MIKRFLIPFRFAVCLLGPALAESGRGAGLASGFGADATPAEAALATQPEPDGYFREMTGFWHGVPGLDALRTRWEGFAAEDAGFAVLAALISESEGKPEEALEKLQGLPGHSARWNEGRLLALLGREGEAVAVLSALVTAAERPEMGAAALIALTELDCIRGDFTKALQRAKEAWESRAEEGFRLAILERHLSLLVRAGQEREFLAAQLVAAKARNGEEASRQTADRVLAVMADWFAAEPELREILTRVQLRVKPLVPARAGDEDPRSSFECGLQMPADSVLPDLARQENAPVEWADAAALLLANEGTWPEDLESLPLFRKALRDQTLRLLAHLFPLSRPDQPLPMAASRVINSMEPGAGRSAAEWVIRAWNGDAGPGEVETLTRILVEAANAPPERPKRPFRPYLGTYRGMPQPTYPSAEVIWNLDGSRVAESYRLSCRLAPLKFRQKTASDVPGRKLHVAALWRPHWPTSGSPGGLMTWAWDRLMECRAATPELAAGIASRMVGEGDRVRFAGIARQGRLLSDWCQDAAFVARVPSADLMLAAEVISNHLFYGNSRLPNAAEARALLNLAEEMGRRLALSTDQVISHSQLFTCLEQARQVQRKGFSTKPLPHPLYGLPVCPSVERYRILAEAWRPGGKRGAFAKSPLAVTLGLLAGWVGDDGQWIREPEWVEQLEGFPTAPRSAPGRTTPTARCSP